MSGIYIPGMEMPEDEAVGLFLYPDGTVHVWRKTSAVGQEYDAIAVPEHGRLIDADVLFDFILNIYKNAQGEARKAYSDVLDMIVATGDVIPADKEEQT